MGNTNIKAVSQDAPQPSDPIYLETNMNVQPVGIIRSFPKVKIQEGKKQQPKTINHTLMSLSEEDRFYPITNFYL